MKRRWTVLILLVICSLMFTTCEEPPVTESQKLEIPPGKGAFSIVFADSAARTILPTAPVLADYQFIKLIFEPTSSLIGNTAVAHDEVRAQSGANYTILLDAGTYDITVEAYLGGTLAAPTQLAARGILPAISLAEGENKNENIQLTALLNEGTGNFNWGINITASDVTAATMTIMQGTTHYGNSPVTLALSGNSSGNPTLNSGIYNVQFRLTKQTGNPVQTFQVELNELLYVYSSLDSNYLGRVFDDNFFHRIQYNVSFVYNDGAHVYKTTATPDGVQSVQHAGVLGTVGTPVSRGYRFDGWFTDNTTFLNEWNPATDPVFNDMTLYAKWTPNQINLTLLDVNNIPADAETFNSDITLSRSGTGGFPVTTNVNITGTYTSFEWSIRGVGIYAGEVVSGTTSPIVLDASNIRYNSLGWHVVELRVVRNGQTLLTSFRFRIVL